MADQDLVTRRECHLKHQPIEQTMKDIKSKLNWFMFFVLLTLGGIVTNLIATMVNGK